MLTEDIVLYILVEVLVEALAPAPALALTLDPVVVQMKSLHTARPE